MNVAAPQPDAAAARELCDLLLLVAGRNTGRMQTARRHAMVLERAFPFLDDTQRAIARARLDKIETKWGCLFWDDLEQTRIGRIQPEMRVAHWLSTRRYPERLLYLVRRAAIAISQGQTSMRRIMDYAYAQELDMVPILVGQTSFTEWMLELLVAHRAAKGCYIPGPLCSWWAEDMIPSRAPGAPYAICLKLLAGLRPSYL